MTMLIAKLCALCAVSAAMEMIPIGDGQRSGFRLVCGLLMLRLTVLGLSGLLADVLNANSLTEIIGLLSG